MTSAALIVFLKAPRAGLVKTRLAQSLGPDAAVEAYRTLVRRVLDQLVPFDDVELRFTPDDAAGEIAPWCRSGWHTAPQGAGDLGVRLARAFAAAFAAGHQRALVIGSDCPYLLSSDLEAAWAGLDEADVVLGPAVDGGYWLIGLRAPCPALFEEIPWSTSDVLETTLSRCRALGLAVRLLRELADVDTASDWQRFKSHRPEGHQGGQPMMEEG